MYDLKRQEICRDFVGHNGAVKQLHFEKNILATASQDTTVKVWKF